MQTGGYGRKLICLQDQARQSTFKNALHMQILWPRASQTQSRIAMKAHIYSVRAIHGFGSVDCDKIDPHRRAGFTRTGPIIVPAEWTTTWDSQHPHPEGSHTLSHKKFPYEGARAQSEVNLGWRRWKETQGLTDAVRICSETIFTV